MRCRPPRRLDLRHLCMLVMGTILLLAACSDENNDGAGSVTGSGVEVNCALDKVRPGSTGDVRVDVACQERAP